MTKKIINTKDLKVIEKSTPIRREIARESFQLFFEIYFAHYITSPIAWFQKEMFHLIEDEKNLFTTIMAFRGSGKSTIINTAFPLWSILGRHNLKFIVIIAQTQSQAKLYMRNLKEEILNNELLKKDLWPFREEGDESNASSIVLLKSEARITVISVDQSVRGIRHRNHRPQLIIADDIEDLQSVKTREWRDKLFEWWTKEIIPLGDAKKTRMFLVGNMLHRDSLLMRMKDRVESGQKTGYFRKYPLLNAEGRCLWPERFSESDIEELKKTVWSEVAWRTEYMLEDAWAEWQIVFPEWIHWYDDFPEPAPAMINEGRSCYGNSLPHPIDLNTGVDLAISESAAADYTAFVTGWEWGKFEHKILFVVDALARKMDFSETAETLAEFHQKQSRMYKHNNHEVIIETVGYQAAMEQYLRKGHKMDIIGLKPHGSKRERLALITDLIKTWRIKFPRTEAGIMLVDQLIGFWKERHDDLVDAFTMMVNHAFWKKDHNFGIYII